MANNVELKVRIGAELKEIQSALTRLQSDLQTTGKRGADAGKQINTGMAGVKQSIDSVKNSVLGFAAAWASFATVKQLVQMADQVKLVEARIKLVTSSTEEFTQVQAALIAISDKTRSSFADTAELYAKIARSAQALGASSDTLLQVTETINKSVQISGVTAESANAALIQLGQGLASGALRGDELRSVLEQVPRLAQAIANGMGITVGELRKVGEAGQITSEQVINALLKQKDVIDKEFAQVPVTVGQAFTQMSNSVQRSIADIDNATGATSGIALVLQDLAGFLNSGVLQSAFLQVFTEWKAAASDYVDGLGQALDIAKQYLSDYLASYGTDLKGVQAASGETVDFIIGAFRDLPTNIKAFLRLIITEALATFDKIKAYAGAFKDGIKAVFTDDTVSQVVARTKAELDAINQARQDSVDAILNERNAEIEAGKATVDRFQKERAEREKATGKALAPQAIAPKAAVSVGADPLALMKDQIQRELAEIDQMYKDGELSAEAYYTKRKDLALAAIDNEIATQQEALSKTKSDDLDKRQKHITDIAILERKRLDVIKAANHDEMQDAEQLQTQLSQIRARALAIEGQTFEAKKIELQLQFKDLLQKLAAEGDQPGIDLVNKLINVEAAKARLDELKTEMDKSISEQRFREEDIGRQREAGIIGEFTAADQINASRKDTIATLEQEKVKLQELLNTTKDPAVIEQIRKVDGEIQKLGKSAPTILTQIGEKFTSGLGTAFGEIISGTKSVSQAFRDMARNFIAEIAKMAAEALAKKAILALIGAAGGPGSGVGGFLSAFVKHEGGVVGNGGRIRSGLSPLVFAGAPRYHSGGIAGLKPGEVPAILQNGEEVLTKDDPRHAGNGGGGQQGGSGTRVINVIDPNMVSDYMSSSQGEQVLVNILQRNAGTIRQVLA